MKRYSTADLRKLQVINLCDGACLGYVTDLNLRPSRNAAECLLWSLEAVPAFSGLESGMI